MIKCVIDFEQSYDLSTATKVALGSGVDPLDIRTSFRPLKNMHRFVGYFETKAHARQFIDKLLSYSIRLENMEIHHRNRLKER